MKKRKELKILLMQIRDDEVTRKQEFDEFVRYGKLDPNQITVLDVFKTPFFDVQIIDEYDALFVGGSSDASVRLPEVYIFVESCKKLMKHCYDNDVPTLASCFGFQLAVEALGKKIILDAEAMEMGTYDIILNDAAKTDKLFSGINDSFMAVSGHKERALELPDNAILLASSTLCPYHAFTFKNKPFYAFQFHPEVDKDDLIARITRYKDRYLDGDGHLQKIIDSCQETPQSNQLIENFIDKIILK